MLKTVRTHPLPTASLSPASSVSPPSVYGVELSDRLTWDVFPGSASMRAKAVEALGTHCGCQFWLTLHELSKAPVQT